MPTFIFKFESLLKHRRTVEDERQRALAAQIRCRMILHDQLRTMQESIRASKRQLGDKLVGKVDVAAISRFAGYSGHVTQRAQQMVMKLAEVEKKIDEARGRLLEATRQCKALELLRDKHYEAWRREQQRREDVELDEIATQRYARAMMTGSVL